MITSRWRAAVLLVATFAAGAAVGALGASRLHDRPRGPRSEWYLRHLDHELDLTAAQRDSVRAVLERYGPRMDALMQEVRPRMDVVRDSMRTDINRILDDTQRKEFERMRQHTRDSRRGGGDARR
ncbi:MAG: hypothetical protein MUC69_03060 [Gemmatimonadales bacterium]|nr:hypothetical protein [Gemmatimonadales bacterium]